MAGSVPEIEEIKDRETLEAYLRTRPVAESQILALRCALRVMPLVGKYPSNDQRRKQIVFLSVFRMVLFCFSAKAFPGNEAVFASAASAAATGEVESEFEAYPPVHVAVSAAAASVSSFASDTLSSAHDTAFVSAANAVDSAIAAIPRIAAVSDKSYPVLNVVSAFSKKSVTSISHSAPPDERIWKSVRDDLYCMFEFSSFACLGRPLWRKGSAPALMPYWGLKFRMVLEKLGPHWRVIYALYHAMVYSQQPFAKLGSQAEDVLLALSKEDRDFWEREPDEVMRDLAERLKGGEANRQFELGLSVAPEKVDFFVSYSTENLPVAQEVNGYLKDAGFSTIAQFQDFSTGSNFVTEIQKGLERAGRVVALLSPAYVASKHCQAEWNAAYNQDPSGADRHLVQILIEDASLPPLARQIVYRSIVGLAGDARRVAVLEAVGKLLRPEVPNIRSPYDFELTARQTVEATGGAMNTISVLPNRDPNDARRRLEAARETAADLIADLRNSLFQVAPHYVTELERYQNRLPLDAGESIYSADAALRNIRDDLERDIQHGIDDRFLSRARRLIEAHYGLRIYFPELLEFYEDVRQSRQTEPVPLEALGKLRKAIEEHTPDVFEPSVGEAFAHAVDVAPAARAESNDALVEAGHPPVTSTLPPDPIANVDPVRAAQHAEMSMQNRIWALLRGVEKGGKALERIEKVSSTYQKWIDPILDWLSKSN